MISCFTSRSQQLIVTPYIQPGNAPSLDREEKVIIWQTDSVPAAFKVEYGSNPTYGYSAIVNFTRLHLGNTKSILYRAILPDLKFDKKYYYRVSMNGNPIHQSLFVTRTKKSSTRFIVFGDCGINSAAQAQIANQAYLKKPDFILITGDNVYSRGQASEYLKNYFPYYNMSSGSGKGVPLMQSIPFYLAIGNHDVGAANLARYPDGLAYYYYFDLPLNSPAFQQTVTPVGRPDQIAAFKQATGIRFPNMANYSFDHGNVHIVCLDANIYINPRDPELIQWIENDIKNSNATWKIVAFHHPGFNSSRAHYNAQWMRVLAPVFERSGVDLVLNGHVHNYQRSHPLKFEPAQDSNRNYIIDTTGRVNGTFSLDKEFDGKKKTQPEGVLYIVTGAGGAPLYDTAFSNKPELWKHLPAENWVPFTAKLISHIHSFSLIETNRNQLILRQIDVHGNLIDQIKVTK